jgi:hypothetical protein
VCSVKRKSEHANPNRGLTLPWPPPTDPHFFYRGPSRQRTNVTIQIIAIQVAVPNHAAASPHASGIRNPRAGAYKNQRDSVGRIDWIFSGVRKLNFALNLRNANSLSALPLLTRTNIRALHISTGSTFLNSGFHCFHVEAPVSGGACYK